MTSCVGDETGGGEGYLRVSNLQRALNGEWWPVRGRDERARRYQLGDYFLFNSLYDTANWSNWTAVRGTYFADSAGEGHS